MVARAMTPDTETDAERQGGVPNPNPHPDFFGFSYRGCMAVVYSCGV